MENKIQFIGDGPFDLPRARAANVEPRGNGVVISFQVQLAPSRQVVLRIAVPSSQARTLADEIVAAAQRADDAKKKAKKSPD